MIPQKVMVATRFSFHWQVLGWGLLALCSFIAVESQSGDTVIHDNEQISGNIKGANTWEAYKVLLETQRKAQKEAIKQILSIVNTEKQYEMLHLVTQKILEVLKESRSSLVTNGFSATGEFPQEEQLRDSLSQLIENTLLYADLALRFPTFTHRVFDKSKSTREFIKWCFLFVADTKVTVGTSADKAIHLASQELNFIQREDDYTNPFVEELEIKLSKLVQEEMKKKNVKKNKGPRISARRAEL